MEVKINKVEVHPATTDVLTKCVTYLSRVIDPLTRYGTTFASVMLAGMMFLTFFDVAGRGLGSFSFIQDNASFFKPIVGSNEVTEFLMVMLVSFALAYCAQKKGHIRVDLVLQYVSKRANIWFDIFTYAISFIFFVFITWQGWMSAMDSVTSRVSSSVLLIPNYPFIFIMVIGSAFLTIVFLRDFLESIREVTR
jgi:TRAP-type C4-dicarboxylate transport system permease small subunit